MIRNLIRYGGLGAVIVALAACEKTLEVTNPNQPETERVLATAKDVESLIGTYYKRWHSALWSGRTNIRGMANVMAFENFSSLNNDGQNNRYPFSGAFNDNSVGNGLANYNSKIYFVHSEVNRVASSVIDKIEGGLNLGSPAADLRALAFAEFLRGVSIGYIAMFYDSAAIIGPGTSAEEPGPMIHYPEAMDSAITALERALVHTAAAGSAIGTAFPLPSTWIPSPTNMTQTEFTRLIRSYRARFRANVARTPAERADISQGGMVDWAATIADATAGIQADHLNITNSVAGPFNSWVSQYDTYGLWHQMPPFIIGMADVSGRYSAFLSTPLGDRGAGNNGFFMVTPDLRFPQGATRALQQTDFAITSCQGASQLCKRYFANRTGTDQFAGIGWGWSNYDFVRWHSWRVSGDGTGTNGPLLFFARAEVDLLAAEGHIRLGNFAAALPLINRSRTAGMVNNIATGGGLPAIVAADNTTPVPGGVNCVPKVPQPPAFTTADCGNLMEAMKWEKRIETAYTGFSQWYLDHRGWGDLAEGTPLFWVTPFEDMKVRGKQDSEIYNSGPGGLGFAPNSAAAKGTYGW